MELDKKDHRILAALQADARQSLSALGRRIGLSQPAIIDRVKKLEAAGVNQGYHASVDQSALGRPGGDRAGEDHARAHRALPARLRGDARGAGGAARHRRGLLRRRRPYGKSAELESVVDWLAAEGSDTTSLGSSKPSGRSPRAPWDNRRVLIDFFLKLKSHKLPVSIKEYLTLLEAMDKNVIGPSVDEFYYLSRTALVKDEANFDKFDRAFAEFWQGVETIPGIEAQIPLEWLLKQVELTLTEEEKKQIEALGGWEKLMETLKQRLEEQKGRHQGGNKWIGTGGTSPFGAYGYNPEGIRIGQDKSRNRSAVKVWDQREYRNLDDSVELGTRNIKVALRRLRKFAREGAPDEFDLENTISSTARKAYLDIHMRPERRNAIKVLMLMDIGGTMDDHIKLAEEMF